MRDMTPAASPAFDRALRQNAHVVEAALRYGEVRISEEDAERIGADTLLPVGVARDRVFVEGRWFIRWRRRT
jgi:hypothetical protein